MKIVKQNFHKIPFRSKKLIKHRYLLEGILSKQKSRIMKKITFHTRLEAIDWIAANTDNEGQFEALREQLNFNYIYHQRYFLDLTEMDTEIVMLDRRPSGPDYLD